jgi:diguanylate cyclase (GGDEF)-like protein
VVSDGASRGETSGWIDRAAQELGLGTERAAADVDQGASEADQTASEADQTASDTDQTASEADQTASERDEADAIRDQAVTDLEQARAERGGPSDIARTAREQGEAHIARDATRASRQVTHATRVETARGRLGAATGRDATAADRDQAASQRDLRAQALERALAESDASLAEKLELLRVQAAADRARAALDRARAAQDRATAAREREALEQALHEAYVDELTGALRRKLGMLALGQEIDRARRGGGRLVCAFVDVDDLKRVNDRDGHAAGDRVLRALVSIMRTNLRSFDPIVRYGGDEFVCALGGVDFADVERRFALIDRALQATVGAGISVGLAALAEGELLDDVMTRADAALLAAKQVRGA